MRHDKTHLTREEILLFVDGEMETHAATKAEAHLASCPYCSIAKQKIVATLNTVDEIYRTETPQERDRLDHSSLLQMRLKQEAKSPEKFWKSSILLLQPISYVAIALVIVTLSVGLAHYRSKQPIADYSQDLPVPNPNLTPGAAKQVRYEDLCPEKNDDKDPAVPIEVQRAVFREYGLEAAKRENEFQIDYLINPQLGGTAEIRNLWPQPYKSTVWNAHAKDALEDRLHRMFCSREIELSEAQKEIATDWIGAYKKYFRTQTPLREEALLQVK